MTKYLAGTHPESQDLLNQVGKNCQEKMRSDVIPQFPVPDRIQEETTSWAGVLKKPYSGTFESQTRRSRFIKKASTALHRLLPLNSYDP
jgi:hypothetical protein